MNLRRRVEQLEKRRQVDAVAEPREPPTPEQLVDLGNQLLADADAAPGDENLRWRARSIRALWGALERMADGPAQTY